LTQLNPI